MTKQVNEAVLAHDGPLYADVGGEALPAGVRRPKGAQGCVRVREGA